MQKVLFGKQYLFSRPAKTFRGHTLLGPPLGSLHTPNLARGTHTHPNPPTDRPHPPKRASGFWPPFQASIPQNAHCGGFQWCISHTNPTHQKPISVNRPKIAQDAGPICPSPPAKPNRPKPTPTPLKPHFCVRPIPVVQILKFSKTRFWTLPAQPGVRSYPKSARVPVTVFMVPSLSLVFLVLTILDIEVEFCKKNEILWFLFSSVVPYHAQPGGEACIVSATADVR